MTPPATQDAQGGFVLVNALVLVAAMAAAAIFVLGRAEEARVQRGAEQTADQLFANLDAFEAFAILSLAQDNATVDHLGDNWIRRRGPLDLARGQVEGTMTDLEARFNLNWLANPADPSAQQDFERLLQRLSLRRGIADILQDTLPFDTSGTQDYQALDPPQAAMAGPRTLMRQIRDVPGISSDEWRTLSPYVTILPADSGININTASEPVLNAVLSVVSPTQIKQLITQRQKRPFPTVDAFKLALEALLGEDTTDTLNWARMRVSSTWVGVTVNASFDGQVATRQLVLERSGRTDRARVHWRISQIGATTPQGEAN